MFTTPAPTNPVTRDTLQSNTRDNTSSVTQAPRIFSTTPSPQPFQSFSTASPSSSSSLSRVPKLLEATSPVSRPQPVVDNKVAQLTNTPTALLTTTNNNIVDPVPASAGGSPALASSNGNPPQNAPITVPRIPIIVGDGSKCQHPKGSGSYTCLSFGAPQKPIFAFHTIQDEDGVKFGTNSGFPDDEEVTFNEVDNDDVSNVRRIRKVLVKKANVAKKYYKKPVVKMTPRRTYDFNSEKKKRMVSYPIPNKLLLSSVEDDEVSIQRYEYPLV